MLRLSLVSPGIKLQRLGGSDGVDISQIALSFLDFVGVPSSPAARASPLSLFVAAVLSSEVNELETAWL